MDKQIKVIDTESEVSVSKVSAKKAFPKTEIPLYRSVNSRG